MHIAVTWDIAASGDRWRTIDAHLRRAFNGYSWIRPVSTFFVVKLPTAASRNEIADDLMTRAKAVSETVEVLVSPVMFGDYAGLLKPDVWPDLNERTS